MKSCVSLFRVRCSRNKTKRLMIFSVVYCAYPCISFFIIGTSYVQDFAIWVLNGEAVRLKSAHLNLCHAVNGDTSKRL